MKTPGKKKAFTSLKNLCKETKLREFQFKLIHRTVVTERELFRFGIKPDDDCLYCGEKDSTDHSFKDCHFVNSFETEVIKRFSTTNNSQLNPSSEEKLFGLIECSYNTELARKFNYTMLLMRYHTYNCKLHDKPIIIRDFINKNLLKYKIGNNKP